MGNAGRVDTDVVREVYEGVCRPGATVPFRQLKLTKVDASETQRELWAIYRDEDYIETVDVSKFRSAGDLERVLNAVADGHEFDTESLCADCPLGAVPGD